MKLGKKYKASLALGISILGAVGTLPLAQGGFFIGMLHNGFLAATIGGLADWFAVTALFRRPLGISYRTELIIRNRKRIMDSIVEFASKDLLSSQNIISALEKQKLGSWLANYLDKNGQERLWPILEEVLSSALRELPGEKILASFRENKDKIFTEALSRKLAKATLKELLQRENIDSFVNILLILAKELLKEEELKALMAKEGDIILAKYAQGGMGRELALNFMNMNGQGLVEKIWSWSHEKIGDIEKQEESREKLVNAILSYTAKEEVKGKIQEFIYAIIREKSSGHMLEEYTLNFLQDEKKLASLTAKLYEGLGFFIKEFQDNIFWQEQAELFLKKGICKLIDDYGNILPEMIEERLNNFSDEDLVSFAEGKVADDLQMIRINGSVVGALAGMLLYCFIYLARQVHGL